jgi:hypothetical protein
MTMKDYRVWMHSRPAMGREFYEGKVDVRAENDEQAEEYAIQRAARVHGHRDWSVVKVERGPRT